MDQCLKSNLVNPGIVFEDFGRPWKDLVGLRRESTALKGALKQVLPTLRIARKLGLPELEILPQLPQLAQNRVRGWMASSSS